MRLISTMADKTRQVLRTFLQIDPASDAGITIHETLTYEGEAGKNRIWYRGDANELSQLYKSIDGGSERSMFWAAVPSTGNSIRKIHTGLPGMVVDVLTSIVMADLNDIEAGNTWNEMMKDEKFAKSFMTAIEDAVSECLVVGDGAFKISIDPQVCKYPIVEFVPGDRVRYTMSRGLITAVEFTTPVEHKGNKYVIRETYGYGYIMTEVLKNDREVLIDSIPQTKGIAPFVEHDKSYSMALPMKIYKSHKWKERGESILSRKCDNFDALDEVWSQWMEAIRLGRASKYIPEGMLPRNPQTGEILKPNGFDNAYIQRESPMVQNAYDKIDVVQPEIPHESYIAAYVTALDLCLQGIISPSTLGIDTKKLDNAEAQREKEKTTLYTRNKIIDALNDVIPGLVNAVLSAYAQDSRQVAEPVEVTISFGEYANPSFESQIETVSKGRQGGVMSTQAAVEELYGDTKDDEWKAAEVQRIKEEMGIAQVEEPAILDEENEW